MSGRSPELLGELLQDVSRSFYLTLRVLPSAVRRQIGLAYLLARTTDTIADTELVPVAQRLEALRLLAARIQGQLAEPLDFSEIALAQSTTGASAGGSRAERILLQRVEEAISLLSTFEARDQQQIREVLLTITSGQETDLLRFGTRNAEVLALKTDSELDDYTYRVAGCVGEFWTQICSAHLFPQAKIDFKTFLANGIRFGQGLQLVNILRDLPSDLRQGRCYIPQTRLAEHGLKPSDLLAPEKEPAFRSLYNDYLRKAAECLADGWNYTCTVPRKCVRVRLACAWPVLIGAQTLGHLRTQTILDPAFRVKVSRRDVRKIMLSSILRYPFPDSWAKLFQNDQLSSR
jgi:farnesyl-diphosphate farnesyltransferase